MGAFAGGGFKAQRGVQKQRHLKLVVPPCGNPRDTNM